MIKIKIKEISYSETQKKQGDTRFSSISKTITTNAELHDNETPIEALNLLKKFVRDQLKV